MSIPSTRTLAIVALLLVGAAGSAVVALPDLRPDATVTTVDPGDDAVAVSAAASDVVDLDSRLADVPAAARRPVARAARTGSYRGDVAPELRTALDDVDATYAVRDGRYYAYEWSARTGADARLELRPVDARTALDAVSSPLADAPPQIRRAVDAGAAATTAPLGGGVYRDAGTGTYYAVAPPGVGRTVGALLVEFLASVVAPIGQGYLAVAAGLLWYRRRDGTERRLLGPARAGVVASLAVPIALFGALVAGGDGTARFVLSAAASFGVAAGVVAGTFARQRRWPALAGVTAAVVVSTVGGGGVAGGVGGAVLGAYTAAIGLPAGVVPFGYGYAFARERPERRDPPAPTAD